MVNRTYLLTRLCWLSVAVASLLFGPALLECVAKPFPVLSTLEAPETIPPEYVSASINSNGVDVFIFCNEPIVAADLAGFTFTPSGGAATLTLASGSGTTTLVCTSNRVLLEGETATVAYDDSVGDVTDIAGNALASFAATAVTNNSIQTDAPDAPVITSHGGTASISVNEGLATIAAMTATPDVGTWSISGTDAAAVQYVGTSGGNTTISFVTAPDYETPTDTGGDNVYNFTTTFTNESGVDSTDWTVTVANLVDESEPVLGAILTQPILLNASINVTPTVLQGDGLKFAITNQPAGTSFDTATGALTGPCTSLALYRVRITGYIDLDGDNTPDGDNDGDGLLDEPQDWVTFAVPVYSSTETIDAAWVTAEGGWPVEFVSNDSHKLFILAEDLDAPQNAFIFADNNVYIKGDGYDLRYGGTNANTGQDNTYANKEHAFYIYEDWAPTTGVAAGPASISGGVDGKDCLVFDIDVINEGSDPQSHAVCGYASGSFTFADGSIYTDGKDSHCFYAIYPNGRVHFLNSVLTTDTTTSWNRHQGPANIGTGNSAYFTVERCAVIGGNSGVTSYANTEVHKCLISHTGLVTNGYGVWLYETSNAKVTNNIIIPINGRGVICNGGSNHRIAENIILHLEEPNAEFGSALNPPAIRTRYGTSGIIYANNRSLGIGGTGLTSSSTLYVSSYGTGVSYYLNNTGDTILIGSPQIHRYCQPISLEGSGSLNGATNSFEVIDGNTFRSNHNLIRLEGYDGYTRQSTPITNTSFDWVDGTDAYTDFMAAVDAKLPTLGMSAEVEAAATTRIAEVDALIFGYLDGVPLYASKAAWHVKYTSHAGSTTTLNVLDSNWNSVDPDSWTIDVSALYAGAVNAREGFTQSVLLKNSGGTPLANVEVLVTSDQGDSYSVTTDASGNALITFYRFAIIKADASGAPISVVNRTSSTVSYGGESAVITHASVPAEVELN